MNAPGDRERERLEGYRGALSPQSKPRKARARGVPVALQRGEPVAVVTAVDRYVKYRIAIRETGGFLTVTLPEVIAGIGLADGKRLPAARHVPEQLGWATLLALGFVPGHRGRTRVLRLPPSSPAAGTSSRADVVNLTAPAQRTCTGPARAETTQRRLAAEKCVKPGKPST